MATTELIVAVFGAFTLSLIFTWGITHANFPRIIPLDIPNHRSLHTRPIPRCGGIPIAATLVCAATLFQTGLEWLFTVAVVLSFVSYLDDLRGLPIILRLTVHLIAGGGVGCYVSETVQMAIVISIGIAALINFYNFIDGSNGLAGSISAIGFAVLAIAAFKSGAWELALAASIITGAAAGFLPFNAGQARIFLGDTGSIPLGFLAGAMGILGWHSGIWSLLFPVLVFLPVIADTVATLGKRVLAGKTIWHAHREHYYQRLIQLGWSHQRVALTYSTLTAVCAGFAFLTQALAIFFQFVALMSLLIIAIALMHKVDLLWESRQQVGIIET